MVFYGQSISMHTRKHRPTFPKLILPYIQFKNNHKIDSDTIVMSFQATEVL